MKAWEANQRCVGRNAVAVAEALSLQPITVRRWKQDPEDGSGSRSPLETVRDTIQVSLNLGTPRSDAFAPIYYLCNYFNLDCPLPRSTVEGSITDVNKAHTKLFFEFSHLLEEHTQAMVDNRISPDERRRIEREIDHVMHQLQEYRSRVSAAVGALE